MSALTRHLHEILPVLDRVGLHPSAEELADVLWLAHYLPRPLSPELPKPTQQSEPHPADHSLPPPAPEEHPKPPPKPPTPRPQRNEAALYPGGDGGGDTPARPFRTPAVPMLPEALDLGRALRLLHHKVRSRTRHCLDEDATVERIAEQRLWQPVLNGQPERWLELAFIIDRGATMKVWRPTLDELRRLFSYNGAFRTVYTWELNSDHAQAEWYTVDSRRKCRPQELLRPDGRRLIVIATDCIGTAWHSGSVNTWLMQWQSVAPVAILHMLPQRLWPLTALGRGSETRFFSHAAGLPNLHLTPDQRDFWLEWDEDPQTTQTQLRAALKLPVITLEHETLAGWANLLRGKGWMSGFLFAANAEYAISPATSPDAGQIDKRLRQFRKASKPAKQLAAYLAAVPLNLHIMRLVQHAMLPDSRLTHLAEVLVSGLLREVSAEDCLPELVQYEFHPEVRPALLKWVPATDAVRVLLAVSEYITGHSGQCLDFMALLADPEAGGDLRLEGDARYFARLGARVLRRLGGIYQGIADRLEDKASNVNDFMAIKTKLAHFRDTLRERGLGPEMISLKDTPLKFKMGDYGYEDEKPIHEVILSPFAIGKYPVTFEEYDRFCEATGRDKPDDQGWGQKNRPVIHVSWEDAKAYCQWLTDATGFEYRLLTEAEWEYACRAGSDTAYCFGEDAGQLDEYAWYKQNSTNRTHRVGQKKPNAFGIHEMHGNVWEWVNDWYDENHFKNVYKESPTGPKQGTLRVFRGGCWGDTARDCRSGVRVGDKPSYHSDALGFRLARNDTPSRQDKDRSNYLVSSEIEEIIREYAFTAYTYRIEQNNYSQRDEDDWKNGELHFISEVLEGNINFIYKISPDDYWRLQGRWLTEVKNLKAYYASLSHLHAPPYEQYLYGAHLHYNNLLINKRIKHRVSDFYPIKNYINSYLTSDGKLDFQEATHKLITSKASRIAMVTYQSHIDSWIHAETYARMYYENIIPAIESQSRSEKEEKTLRVLKAFQYSKTPENRFLIINCFEVAIAIYFLDPDIIKFLWRTSSKVAERYYSKADTTSGKITSIETKVYAPEWPKSFKIPSSESCHKRFYVDDKFIVYHGVMSSIEYIVILDNLEKYQENNRLLHRNQECLDELCEKTRVIIKTLTL